MLTPGKNVRIERAGKNPIFGTCDYISSAYVGVRLNGSPGRVFSFFHSEVVECNVKGEPVA